MSLHRVTRARADVPVVLIDTGYLFPETYCFVDALRERLRLNLKVYRPELGPAWMEARLGKLWEQGVEGIRRYNHLHKVEPMRRALDEPGARTWIAGIRRSPSESRASAQYLERHDGRWKFHPIVDWRDHDVWRYLTRHGLPTTRCGTGATCRSATCTRCAAGSPACARRTPASSASRANAAGTWSARIWTAKPLRSERDAAKLRASP